MGSDITNIITEISENIHTGQNHSDQLQQDLKSKEVVVNLERKLSLADRTNCNDSKEKKDHGTEG